MRPTAADPAADCPSAALACGVSSLLLASVDATALPDEAPSLTPPGWGAWGADASSGAGASLWAAADDSADDAAGALHDVDWRSSSPESNEDGATADATLRAHCEALR